MNKLKLAFLAALLFQGASIAQAEDSPLSVDLSTSVLTDYMFRGQNLYDGTSIQPYAAVNYDTGYGKVSGSLWMHLSAEGDRQAEKFTELDETISYSTNITEEVGVKVGHLWYTFPDDNDDINDTAEWFGGVSFNDSELSPFALNPSLTIYKDYREVEYVYYELTMSHNFESDSLGKGFNVAPYATFGFASNSDKVYQDDGLEQITVGANFALKLGDIAVTPSLNYTFKVDDNTTNEFWVGTTFAYSL